MFIIDEYYMKFEEGNNENRARDAKERSIGGIDISSQRKSNYS